MVVAMLWAAYWRHGCEHGSISDRDGLASWRSSWWPGSLEASPSPRWSAPDAAPPPGSGSAPRCWRTTPLWPSRPETAATAGRRGRSAHSPEPERRRGRDCVLRGPENGSTWKVAGVGDPAEPVADSRGGLPMAAFLAAARVALPGRTRASLAPELLSWIWRAEPAAVEAAGRETADRLIGRAG